MTSPVAAEIPASTLAFYREAVDALLAAQAPFLVGGSYAFERYTGIARHSKDFDIFVREADLDEVLSVLRGQGYRVDRIFPHWLAKAYQGEDYVDVIYSSGSGLAVVDEEWFTHAVEGVVLGAPVRLIPPEEMIWSKAYVMERERYDGSDVAHLLYCQGRQLDWDRLLRRFGEDWRVLLSYLVLFGFIYPFARERVPAAVMDELTERLRAETRAAPPGEKVCGGTLISRAQFLHDVQAWGFRDARLHPRVRMDEEDIALWTAEIGRDR